MLNLHLHGPVVKTIALSLFVCESLKFSPAFIEFFVCLWHKAKGNYSSYSLNEYDVYLSK